MASTHGRAVPDLFIRHGKSSLSIAERTLRFLLTTPFEVPSTPVVLRSIEKAVVLFTPLIAPLRPQTLLRR